MKATIRIIHFFEGLGQKLDIQVEITSSAGIQYQPTWGFTQTYRVRYGGNDEVIAIELTGVETNFDVKTIIFDRPENFHREDLMDNETGAIKRITTFDAEIDPANFRITFTN